MKAVLVYMTVITRVVVPDDAPDEYIDRIAAPRLGANIECNGIMCYIDNYEPDLECPYDPDTDDKEFNL